MKKRILSLALALTAAILIAQHAHAQTSAALAPVSTFDRIADKDKRAVALFQEAGKVILSPRCVNCHPADDHPRQGEAMRVHEPPVERGDAGIGAVGMRCFTCHGPANFDRVPGNPRWVLAPKDMAWAGRSLGQICEQIKDPKRNGGKTLEQIVEHMAHDELVGWGWNPGMGRVPAPGSQDAFGALIKAWADNGAQCPKT
jgi:hypothetical protein